MYLHYDKTKYFRSWLDPEQSDEYSLFKKVKKEVLTAAMQHTKIKGLVLEFGVGWGQSITHISTLTNQHIDGFDSWQGIPEQWMKNPKGSFTTNGNITFSVPDNVTLHSGWFKDTIPIFKNTNDGKKTIRFLHIDCDLYSSTNTIFQELGDQIVSGTVIVFDELVGRGPEHLEHEYKAFQQAVDRYQWKYEYISNLGFLSLNRSMATPQAVVKINE